MQYEPVSVPNWKGFLNFGLKIFTEAEASLDPRFSMLGGRSDERKGPHEDTPEELSLHRIKTLNTAFPVSMERIQRSSLISKVQRIAGFENVSKTQVSQAAINLMLSNELIAGDKHYSQLSGDYCETIWDSIVERSEMADGSPQPANFEPIVVAHQIELDVWSTLKQLERKSKHQPFSKLQNIFRQKYKWK